MICLYMLMLLIAEDALLTVVESDQYFWFNDPEMKKQWYLGHNSTVFKDRHNNIIEAWKLGATGEGVVVAVVDNGVESQHWDLQENMDLSLSYDYIQQRKIQQPYNDNSNTRIRSHGTRMAGIIGMKENNKKCGVGVAFNARMAAIKAVSNTVTDAQLAGAYSHMFDKIHIYSSSFGPPDNGKIISRHPPKVRRAIVDGTRKGRNGLGSIYVHASGNGRFYGDHCGADGTVNNIYSIAVASAARDHSTPYSSEECASILTSVYSQYTRWFLKGYYTDVITTGLGSKCYETQGGSSTATAIVSGIIALALSINKNLTWRDVQYLVVFSSSRNNLTGAWTRNGAGFQVSPQYGYGILNAAKMVLRAKNWTTVEKQERCFSTYLTRFTSIFVPANSDANVMSFSCKLVCHPEVRFIEQVSLITTFQFSRRGDVQVELMSPSGTKSELLGRRQNDQSKIPYRHWRFTSVHYWGEKAAGNWTVSFRYHGSGAGYIKHTYLIIYGVSKRYTYPKH